MEERETYQTDGHCQLALNVDFSRGYIEPRQGFKRVIQEAPAKARLYVHREKGKPSYLLSIGPRSSVDGSIMFRSHKIHGAATSFTSSEAQDLTSDMGEPANLEFECSFVSVILKGLEDPGAQSKIKTKPNYVTIITTPNQMYLFNASEDSSSLRTVDVIEESKRLKKLSMAYWGMNPRCLIATVHQDSVYYAGFASNFQIAFTDLLEDLQTEMPEENIDEEDRAIGEIFPNWIWRTDPFDPLGISAFSFSTVSIRENVTGLKSFLGQLIVFTDQAIYSQTGGSYETWQMFKAVDGVGCVAPNSIIEVGGVLMFMARDGVYAYTGTGQQGSLQKISKQIDSIFTGKHLSTYLPEKVRTDLYSLGYPFEISRDNLNRAQVVHVQSKNQIWWSVNPTRANAEDWNLTLVYDYHHQAWSVFTHGASTAAAPQCCMYDGVSVAIGGRERIFVSSSTGGIFEYAGGHDEYGVGSTASKKNVQMVFISGRMFKENNTVSLYRPIRLKMLSHGSSDEMSDPAFWMAYGEEAHADAQFVNSAGTVTDADSTDRQYTEGTVSLHPAETSNFFYDVGAYKDSVVVGTGNGSTAGFSATVTLGLSAQPYWTDVLGGHFIEWTTGGVTKTVVSDTVSGQQFSDATTGVVASANKSNGATEILFQAGFIPDNGTSITFGVDGGKPLTYQDQDWFTSKIESASIRSRSLRLALCSGYGSTIRPTELAVQSVFVEVQAGDTR
jgi:hypothetical protein